MIFQKTLQIFVLLIITSNLFSLEFVNIGFNNGICKVTDFNSNEELNESCYSWGISTQFKFVKHADIEVDVHFNEFSYSFVGDPRTGLLPPEEDDSTYVQKIENTVSITPISLTIKPSYTFDKFSIYSNIGLSYIVIKSELLGTVTNTKTTGSNNCFGVSLHMGASYNINDQLSIDCSLRSTYKYENSLAIADGYNPLTQSFFLFFTSLGLNYNFD
ncbi:MAG: outer membrane beta-barrel protein [Candidatus Delongbacteria bacterium]|jgi:opacity protein-like surface antigen|nr:outer membrane beta-barrel protein [Candidatus Delongbacteria bacterium]